MTLDIQILKEELEPWGRLAQAARDLPAGKYGAQVSFVGTLRDFNGDSAVSTMELEHYPGMTERQIERLCVVAQQRWEIVHILVHHRIGRLLPGEPIVLISVWSQHRSHAFNACRFLINELKQHATFWKKEHFESGERWVSENTLDKSVDP